MFDLIEGAANVVVKVTVAIAVVVVADRLGVFSGIKSYCAKKRDDYNKFMNEDN